MATPIHRRLDQLGREAPVSTRTAVVGRFAARLLLGVILAAGFGMRIPNLYGPSLNIDEVLHVFTAGQRLEGNPPMLPSGLRYGRAQLYTETVALVARTRGLDEWSARFPSVVFGCLTIVLIFAMTRRWYGTPPALVAALITAAAPMQVAFSREARMYAMFQFTYLLFVFLFFQGMETTPRRRRFVDLQLHPGLLLLAAGAVALSRHLQDLTLVAVSGPAAYLIGMAVAPWLPGASIGIRSTKYVAAAAVLAVGGVSYLLWSGIWGVFVSSLTYVHPWAVQNTSPLFYLRAIHSLLPTMLECLLLAAGVALVRSTKATVYLLLCFGVPLIAQSLLFPTKHERYIFHLVPLMFVIFSVGFWAAVSRLYGALVDWAGTATTPPRARLVAGAAAGTAALTFLLLVPWIRGGASVHEQNEGSFAGVYHENWRSAARYVSDRLGPQDIVIASAPGLAKFYGIEAPTFYLSNDSTDLHLEQGLHDGSGRPIDYIAAAPLILDVEELEEVLARHASGWFVSERFRFDGSRPLPEDIRAVVAAHAERVDLPDAGSMVIWRWQPGHDDR